MVKFSELINSEKPVLIDFSAEWCGPCKMLAPELEKLAKQVEGKARVLKIDIDKNPTLAQNLQISGVPTLMIFQKGELKWRQSGYMTAAQMQKVLDKFLISN
ncbi:MAG: thioredoxin [Microscillaceae bacterium]|nr:thioredoxin [Microscillaceae bacterium]MDW8461224.1 thioredoxin [Cytophagales bacterium]